MSIVNTYPRSHSNSHGARQVHLIIAMIKWSWTSRLSTKNSLSPPNVSPRFWIWACFHSKFDGFVPQTKIVNLRIVVEGHRAPFHEVPNPYPLNTNEYIPHEAGSPFGCIEPEIAQYPKSA